MTNPARAPCPHCLDSVKLFSVPHGLRVHIGRKHKNIVRPATPPGPIFVASGAPTPLAPSPSPARDLPSFCLEDLPALRARVRVLRHIPKGARCLAAGKLATLINNAIKSNSACDWLEVLTFAYTALKVPVQGDKKTLTAKVKYNVEKAHLELPSEFVPSRSPSLYKSVQGKVFEGDLRGAARLLTSDCTFAPSGEETLASLKEKHPAPSGAPRIPPLPDSATPCLVVTLENVSAALQTFQRGSAAGIDGLRPDHLKELTSSSAGDCGLRLLEAITKLCNFLLEGNLSPEVCPLLYGGSLCALQKKDGGVRPIAVGSALRRLVAKLCCQAVRSSMAPYLQPHQVGFGTPLGCEAAIHATRSFVLREGSDDVLVKLDIRNAFNSIDRVLVLEEVKDLTPSIFRFLLQCYATPSYLSYDGSRILSQVGVQQGDPLGPLIFSMAIQKAIKALEAPLNIWYLDDGTIGGHPDVVARDIRMLFPALKDLGLEVNTAKCELYLCSPVAAESSATFESLIPGLRITNRDSLCLLGAPIFLDGVSDSLRLKTATLTSLSAHFHHLPAHVALTLLGTCFAMPKITYVIRTAPCWKFPEEVSRFDIALKQIVEETLNVCLSESQWSQASLPIRFGGLGVRRLHETGPIAFLASAHGVADLVTRILRNGDIVRIPYAEEASARWSVMCPDAGLPLKPEWQRSWDNLLGKQLVTKWRSENTGVDLARINAVTTPESGAWLHALPSPHMGTLLDDDSLRVAAALRLGCPVCEPHTCICGARVEADGHHGLSCTRCAGRRPRHHAINDILKRAFVLAEVPCVLEPPGLSRTDGKRPDGLTLVPWQKGRCLVWDATCVSTFASCHLPATQQSAGAGAEAAARGKRLKYASLEPVYDFVPFAVETSGPWSSEAKQLVRNLGRRLKERGRDPRSGWFLAQQISIAVQRGNAASVLGTFGPGAARGSDP